MNKLNSIIIEANHKIKNFNEKIEKRAETLDNLKNDFWNNMRNEYDWQISKFIYDAHKYLSNKQIRETLKKVNVEHRYLSINQILETEIKAKDDTINQQKSIIIEKQKDVVNCQDAIDNINIGLTNLGMDSFSIEPYAEAL